ncbi:MAG: hypothetical protein ACR2P0_15220 [Acidimicrobiales bacterium]
MFAATWALGNLIHLVNVEGQGFTNPAGWVNAFAAIYVLFKPGSVRRVSFLASAQIVEFVWSSPFSADHQSLAAAANVVLLITILAIARKRGRWPEAHEVGHSAFPALRIVLLIAYVAAALAKYNTTFLDASTSCAAYLGDLTTFGLLGGDGFLGHIHVFAAVVPETLVPLLLVVPFTRRFGVRFACGFHLFIALSPALVVGDFSVILIALFLLFASDRDIEGVYSAIRRRVDRDIVGQRLSRIGSSPAAVAVLAIGVGIISSRAGLASTVLAWGITIATAPRILLALLGTPLSSDAPELGVRRISPAQGTVCALLVVWALSPYIGLRTMGVFTMFSNLRTEGPDSNHLFMPSIDLTDMQNDIVVPIAGSSSHFDDIVENDYAVPMFELRRELAEHPDAHIEGHRNGQPLDDADRQDLAEPLPGLLEKLLLFRTVPAGTTRLCGN